MKVALTDAPRLVLLAERPEPGPPEPGQTLVRVETVGICGSDHLYRDELGDSHIGLLPLDHGPRVLGDRRAARSGGIGASTRRPGRDVANAAVRLVPHLRRGTAQRLRQPADRRRPRRRRPAGAVHRPDHQPRRDTRLSARQASLIEPFAVSYHAVNRGRVAAGEASSSSAPARSAPPPALACADRGAQVIVVDPAATRRELIGSWGSRPCGSTVSSSSTASLPTVDRRARTW